MPVSNPETRINSAFFQQTGKRHRPYGRRRENWTGFLFRSVSGVLYSLHPLQVFFRTNPFAAFSQDDDGPLPAEPPARHYPRFLELIDIDVFGIPPQLAITRSAGSGISVP